MDPKGVTRHRHVDTGTRRVQKDLVEEIASKHEPEVADADKSGGDNTANA